MVLLLFFNGAGGGGAVPVFEIPQPTAIMHTCIVANP